MHMAQKQNVVTSLFHDSRVAKLSDFSLRKDKCTLEFPHFISQKV